MGHIATSNRQNWRAQNSASYYELLLRQVILLEPTQAKQTTACVPLVVGPANFSISWWSFIMTAMCNVPKIYCATAEDIANLGIRHSAGLQALVGETKVYLWQKGNVCCSCFGDGC